MKLILHPKNHCRKDMPVKAPAIVASMKICDQMQFFTIVANDPVSRLASQNNGFDIIAAASQRYVQRSLAFSDVAGESVVVRAAPASHNPRSGHEPTKSLGSFLDARLYLG